MRSKSEVLRQEKKEGKNSSLREFGGPLSPEERRPLQNTSKNTMGQWCSGERTSKTKKDTEQYPLSKVLQSQMAAVKFSDTTSKLPGVAGAPRLSRLPKEECPEYWINIFPRQTKTKQLG